MDRVRERAIRYGRCDPEVIAFAEKEGAENMKGRLATAEAIASGATTTLTVLLAGIGGGLAYATQIFDNKAPPALPFGAACVCVYLCVLAAVLIFSNMRIADAPTLHNEPDNLLMPEADLPGLRVGELARLQGRIDEMVQRNNARSRWLNFVRGMTLLTPVVFVAAIYFR